MTDALIQQPLSRELLELVASPEALHRFVMRLLPDLAGLSTAIRADTNTLFRVDLPTDRFGTPGTVSLRLRSAALPPGLDITEIPVPQPGTPFTVRVAAAQRNTLATGKITATPVPDEKAPAWAQTLLQRHGLHVENLKVSASRGFGRPGGVKFTVRDLTAVLAPGEPHRTTEAFTRGIGHGRAYGLGMILPLSPSQTRS